ncbi:MAG: hypothetical protein ABI580_11010 [Burkholderiaceae bacterium]
MTLRFKLVSMLAACCMFLTINSAATAQMTVNYGVQPATRPIYIARALGLLDPIEKKHNIKVVFRSFAYGAPENHAIAAGELQMARPAWGRRRSYWGSG